MQQDSATSSYRRGRRGPLARDSRAVLLIIAAGWLVAACAPGAVRPADTLVEVDVTEMAAAREAHAELLKKFPPYEHEAVQNYVQAVGRRLLAGAPRTNASFQFTVLDSPGVFAYSFANGAIVVSRGMLVHLNSEAQLAAVLAHEIGHVVSLHQERTLQELRRARALEARLAERFATEQAREVLDTLSRARVRGYSRQHEIEADIWSERLLALAGYDARAVAEVLRFFVQQEAFWDRVGFELWEIPEAGGGQGVFATHPSPAARLELAMKRLSIASLKAGTPDPVYLNVFHGVVFGLSPRYGVQQGRLYVQPARRIAFTLPDGWYLFGADGRLFAASRHPAGLLVISMEDRADGKPLRATLQELAGGRALDSVQAYSAGPSRGETAVVRNAADGEPERLYVAAVDVDTQRVSFSGIPLRPERGGEIDQHVRAVARSVRTVPPAEARRTRAPRVQIERLPTPPRQAPPGQAFIDQAQERWQLLNQLQADQANPNLLIKTVR